jgi:hypothetical protein
LDIVIEDGVLVTINLQETLGIRHAKVFEMQQGMG